MIQTVWPYTAVMLLVAGLFPALERRFSWRLFTVLPPIVLVYLSVTALAAGGLWQVNDSIRPLQSAVVAHLVPALLFLLMIHCDLRAIFRLGPRVLAVFGCTTVSMFAAFLGTFLLYRPWLRGDAWRPLAALSGSWVGGTANMVAVKEAIGMSSNQLAMSLLTDALGYSMWFVVLFSVAPLAPAFNRWTRAVSSAGLNFAAAAERAPAGVDGVLVWLGLSLLTGVVSAWIADFLPTSTMLSTTSWTILLATIAGVGMAHTPLARYPGATPTSSGLLLVVVAVLASQSNFQGISQAPLYLLCGVTILVLHAAVLVGFARLFRFDLYLCGISSMAHVGGVAATPLLAAAYSPVLVPVGILLALLGYLIGTGFGLIMAAIMSPLA